MRGIYFLLFFSCLTILDAFPMDYDESAAKASREALENYHSLLSGDFQSAHTDFLNKKTAILAETKEKIQNVSDTYNQYLTEIDSFAQQASSTNISRCYGELEIIAPQAYLDSLSSTCDSPGDLVAFNFRRLEENKRGYYFIQTYYDLTNTLESCLNFSDPQPNICAGVVASTLQEVDRLSPSVTVQPLQFSEELNRQILGVSECAAEQLTIYVNRLNVWLNTFTTCVEDLINVIVR